MHLFYSQRNSLKEYDPLVSKLSNIEFLQIC